MTFENGKIFVVDDDPFVRKSLDRLMRSAGFAVETFDGAKAFLESRSHKGPSCLVLDVQMPGLNGLELQERLLSHEKAMPIIFITAHGDIPMSVKALKTGAVDFLSKPFDDTDLLYAVHEALHKDSEAWRVREECQKILRRVDALTHREYETLTHVIAGSLNKQIAHALRISEATVKVHRGRIMQKMGVDSVAELVRLTEKVDIKPAERAN
jgi:FixJ family two-component response regulator